MPLLDLWKSNPAAVGAMSIEQVVGTAGDGKLVDGSLCSGELRQFLGQVGSEQLGRYARYCLEESYSKSGMVLQDVVNELGRRLEFDVTNGKYQGVVGGIGYDGIWRDPGGVSLVVEVKTTDAYRIRLDTIAAYRDKLKDVDKGGGFGPGLIVVGRQDTGDLESQIRGSRHAWEFRLISIDALISLVELKESAEAGVSAAKLRRALMPVEYTRLDPLIELMFTAAKQVEAAAEAETPTDESGHPAGGEMTDPAEIDAKRTAILEALAKNSGVHLIKRTRALYWSADHAHRAACTLSKRYTKKGHAPYWFAYHPGWAEFLNEGQTGNFVLGGVDLDVAFAIPAKVMTKILDELNTSPRKKGGEYWHVKIGEPKPGKFVLQLPKSGSSMPLDEFAFTIA